MASRSLPPKTSSKQQADASGAGLQPEAILELKLSQIDATDRLRQVNPLHAIALAEQFKSKGMQSPVKVRGPLGKTGNGDDRFKLVFGGHRFAAHELNGAPTIKAALLPPDVDEDEARLIEIAENVERFPLTALERANSIAAWREIYEKRAGEVRIGRPKKNSAPRALFSDGEFDHASERFAGTFSEAAQEAFGLSRRSVFDALKIASIDTDVKQALAFHTTANSKKELLLLANSNSERQAEICQLLIDEQAATVEEAIALIEKTPAPKRPAPVEKLSNSFSTLKPTEQREFFELHRPAIEAWLSETSK